MAGLAPFVMTHPAVQRLLPFALPVIQQAMPLMAARARLVQEWVLEMGVWLKIVHKRTPSEALPQPSKPIPMVLQRMIDDDRLSDRAWNSEIAEVDLWENERLDSTFPSVSPYSDADCNIGLAHHDPTHSTSAHTSPWSKSNLKSGERTAWTRGRDGWNGVGAGGTITNVEASGEVRYVAGLSFARCCV